MQWPHTFIHSKQTKLSLLLPDLISREERLSAFKIQLSWAQWFCSGSRHRLPDQRKLRNCWFGFKRDLDKSGGWGLLSGEEEAGLHQQRWTQCQPVYLFLLLLLLPWFSRFLPPLPWKSLRWINTKPRGEQPAEELWFTFPDMKHRVTTKTKSNYRHKTHISNPACPEPEPNVPSVETSEKAGHLLSTSNPRSSAASTFFLLGSQTGSNQKSEYRLTSESPDDWKTVGGAPNSVLGIKWVGVWYPNVRV